MKNPTAFTLALLVTIVSIFEFVNFDFDTRDLLNNRAEYEFSKIMQLFSNQPRFFKCPLEIDKALRPLYFVSTFTGPFPESFRYYDDDIIFDISPALFRPWGKHLKRLKGYNTFAPRFTNHTMYNENLSMNDLNNLFKQFVKYFSNLQNSKISSPKYRIVFVCSVPGCNLQYLLGLAFLSLQKDIAGECEMFTIVNAEYYTRFIDNSFIDNERYLTQVNVSQIRDSYNFSAFSDENILGPVSFL